MKAKYIANNKDPQDARSVRMSEVENYFHIYFNAVCWMRLHLRWHPYDISWELRKPLRIVRHKLKTWVIDDIPKKQDK